MIKIENYPYREIREENEEYREYSLKLKKYGIAETRLLPLFVMYLSAHCFICRSQENPSVLLTILKIFVCYTLPIKQDDSCYQELRIGLLRFLEAFISNVLTGFYIYIRMHCQSLLILSQKLYHLISSIVISNRLHILSCF